MILLISGHPEAERCAPVLSRELGESVECADSLRTAAAKLRGREYELVVIDQVLVEIQASRVDALLSRAAPAIPVFFHPAVHGATRLVTEARSALRRREYDRRSAAENALSVLRNDLRSDLTAILLSSHLALDSRTAPETLTAKLKVIYTLADRIGQKLSGRQVFASPPCRNPASQGK